MNSKGYTVMCQDVADTNKVDSNPHHLSHSKILNDSYQGYSNFSSACFWIPDSSQGVIFSKKYPTNFKKDIEPDVKLL